MVGENLRGFPIVFALGRHWALFSWKIKDAFVKPTVVHHLLGANAIKVSVGTDIDSHVLAIDPGVGQRIAMMRCTVSSPYDSLIRRSEKLLGLVLDEIRDPSVAYVEVWFGDGFEVSKL